MDDNSLQSRIEKLVDEEQELRQGHAGRGLGEEQRSRLEAIGVELDRYWDLLRQRRAREEFGQDPNEATVRDADTVERYRQ